MKLMRAASTILLIGLTIYSCTEPDTKAPEVSITSPTNGDILNEIVEISCVATDKGDIDTLELFIDDVSVAVVAGISSHTFLWNTTDYQDAANHVIKVVAIDENGNAGESETLTVYVDQALARPAAIDISSVIYDTERLNVVWERSLITDFSSYELYHSPDTSNFELIATLEHPDSNSYAIFEFDPRVQNFFRITVFDTLGLHSTGKFLSNEIHDTPPAVNVTDVSYTLAEMTIAWEKYVADSGRMQRLIQTQTQSIDALNGTDFIAYELLHSDSFTGEKALLTTISDIDFTSYTLTNFDPTHENWFWIRVNDFWNYSAMGQGLSHAIDPAPASVDVNAMAYDTTAMTITWDPSSEPDFVAYEVLHSESESGDRTSIASQTNIDSTTLVLTDFDPTHENWFWLKVIDHWGLSSTGLGLTHEPDTPPNPVSIFAPHVLSDSYSIGWTQNTDSDFHSYELYEWIGDDPSNKTLIYTTFDRRNYLFNITNLQYEQELHYQVITYDHWGLTAVSNTVDHYIHNTFMKRLGGDEATNAYEVKATSDGGFIVVGEIEAAFGSLDLLYIKLDAYGNEETTKTFEGGGFERGFALDLTSDGGAVLAGSSQGDIWLIKVDSEGNEAWRRTYGGPQNDVAYGVEHTSDGGFILTGSTASFGAGGSDLILLKTDASGNEEWVQYFGDVEDDVGYSVHETNDGGFAAVGRSNFYGNETNRALVVKTNAAGELVWIQNYNGTGHHFALTDDGGFILAGTRSYEPAYHDFWLLKMNSAGEMEWEQTYGNQSDTDDGNWVEQTNDGGFVFTGYTADPQSFPDIRLIKTDASGSVVWSRQFGGAQDDMGNCVQELSNGDLIITGRYSNQMNPHIGLIRTTSEGLLE